MKAKFGRYVFLKKLAVGGMAEIFLARRLSFGGFAKFVVLKRLLPEHRGKRAYEQLFLTEARIHAVLNHPHIVSLHDLGKLDDAYFMAMEYVHGVSGAELMARAAQKQRPIPLGSALYMATAIAEALHYGHVTLDDLGEDPMRILHHDVSPHNIQIGYDGETKLLDYGVATRIGHPAPGGRRGKPAYMSPEAINKGDLDHRSDLFSLAIVLYEMTLSRRLFKAPTAKETMARARAAQVKPPTELDPDYPATLEAILLKALAREPDARYPDGRTFATALRRVGEQLGLDMGQEAFAAYLGELFREEIGRRQAELAALARASVKTRQSDDAARAAAEKEAADAAAVREVAEQEAAQREVARREAAALAAAERAPTEDEAGPTQAMPAVKPHVAAAAAAEAAAARAGQAPPATRPAGEAPAAPPTPATADDAVDALAESDGRDSSDSSDDRDSSDDHGDEGEDAEMATLVKAPADFDLPSQPPTPAPVEPKRTPTPTPVPDVADVGDGELELAGERSQGAGEYEGEDALAYELPPEARDAAAEWDEGTYALPLKSARRRTVIVAVLGLLLAVGAFFAGQRAQGVLGLQTGSVTVDSEPGGATVVVNGKAAGQTPLRVGNLAVGDQLRIELRKDGYAPVERKISIYPDRLDREWTVTLPAAR